MEGVTQNIVTLLSDKGDMLLRLHQGSQHKLRLGKVALSLHTLLYVFFTDAISNLLLLNGWSGIISLVFSSARSKKKQVEHNISFDEHSILHYIQ